MAYNFLTVALASLVLVSDATAQVRALDAPMLVVCTPETEPNGKCLRGDAGFTLLEGAQLNLMQRLFKLSPRTTESEVQRAVGSRTVEVTDPGTTAYLDGKPIRKRAVMMNFEGSGKAQDPMDGAVTVTFANGYLMNIQLGGVDIPRSSLYYAAMECEPNCAGRISKSGAGTR